MYRFNSKETRKSWAQREMPIVCKETREPKSVDCDQNVETNIEWMNNSRRKFVVPLEILEKSKSKSKFLALEVEFLASSYPPPEGWTSRFIWKIVDTKKTENGRWKKDEVKQNKNK